MLHGLLWQRHLNLNRRLHSSILGKGNLDIYILGLTKCLCCISELFSHLMWKAYHKMMIHNHWRLTLQFFPTDSRLLILIFLKLHWVFGWHFGIYFWHGILQNSGSKHISNKMLRQFQNFVSLSQQYVGKKIADNSAEFFVYCVSNSFGIPWHFAEGYDLFFFHIWDYFLYLNYIVYL